MRKDDTMDVTRSEEANPAAVKVLKSAKFFKSDEENEDDTTSEYVTGYVRGGETPRKKRDEVRPSREEVEPKKPIYSSFDDDDDDDNDDLSDFLKNARPPRKERKRSSIYDEPRDKERKESVSSWLESRPIKPVKGTGKTTKSDVNNNSFIEDDYNSSDLGEFRERYNSRDVFSTGKNDDSVVNESKKRRGQILHASPQNRDNKKRKPQKTQNGINPVRVVIAASVIGLLVLVVVVLVQMNSLRTRLNNAEALIAAGAGLTEEEIASMEGAYDLAQDLLLERRDRITVLENFLRSEGYDPAYLEPRPATPVQNQPAAPNQNQNQNGATDTTIADDGTFEPFYITVQSGQILSRIAFAHFGSSEPRYVNHIASTNGLRDPNDITVGQRLRITPLPQ